jgi:hypothetical protein
VSFMIFTASVRNILDTLSYSLQKFSLGKEFLNRQLVGFMCFVFNKFKQRE